MKEEDKKIGTRDSKFAIGNMRTFKVDKRGSESDERRSPRARMLMYRLGDRWMI